MDARKIIDALGGPSAVAKVCKVRPNAVTNWKKRGIPPRMVLKYPQLFLSAFMSEPDQKQQQA